MTDKHVLMFSGGLDSYLALLALLDNGIKPTLVYASHGSKNHFEQFHWAKKLARLHGLELTVDNSLNLGHLEETSAFIPNRNGYLAFTGALYGNRIWFAIMDGEQSYADCKQSTFGALSMALTLLKEEAVAVDSPFWEKTKAEAIGDLEEKSRIMVLNSYSCHRGTSTHCGECSACFRRAVAFTVNGLKDKFKVNPFKTPLAKEYYQKAINGHYGKRDKEILEAFEKAEDMYGTQLKPI